MNESDIEWEKWGARDPYYGVLTAERFRRDRITEADRRDFFQSGYEHVQDVMTCCQRYFGADFEPQSVLDFGCGVGRVLIPFAKIAPRALGLDVSRSMLAETMKNCVEFAVPHARAALSNDGIDSVSEQFDLVHSAITLQHIEVERGLPLIERLVSFLAPAGVLVLHVTYGKTHVLGRYGQPVIAQGRNARPRRSLLGTLSQLGAAVAARRNATAASAIPEDDPIMQMNAYNLSQIAYILQRAGLPGFHAQFVDHGGELGATIYAQRPGAAT